MRREYPIICNKHDDETLAIVYTDKATAWCQQCQGWITTEGKRKRGQ